MIELLDRLVLPELVMPSAPSRLMAARESGAYLSYRVYQDCWALSDVYVVPEQRHRGRASLMLEELLGAAGNREVVLRVAGNGARDTLSNDQLERWYRRHGFEPHPLWSLAEHPWAEGVILTHQEQQ